VARYQWDSGANRAETFPQEGKKCQIKQSNARSASLRNPPHVSPEQSDRQQLQAEVDQRGREQEASFNAEREAGEARERIKRQKEPSKTGQIQSEKGKAQLSPRRPAEGRRGIAAKPKLPTATGREAGSESREFQQQELAIAQEREKLVGERERLELEKQRQRMRSAAS